MESSDNTVLIIPFEKFVLEPDGYIKQLEQFISASVTNQTRSVMKDQRVPRICDGRTS